MTQATLLETIDRAAATQATTLDLSGMNLTELPPEIGKLTHLKTLILGRYGYDEGSRSDKLTNNLTTLPPEIGKLTQLERLKIWNNRIKALPPEIEQLQNLKWLDLSDNKLKVLPPEIGELKNLRSLNLEGNGLKELPSEIGQLQNLRSLYLGSNQLSQLPIEITQLQNLRSLDLSGNQLSQLPIEVIQLQNLQSLNLGSNGLKELLPEITQLQNLRSLHLWNNQLSQLPIEINQLQSLRLLNIGNNQFNQLPIELFQLQNLRSLYLHTIQLSSLPPEIRQLKNLRSLTLSYNQLRQLPLEINQLQSLRFLNLGDNQLSQLPPEIIQLQNLRSLKLWSNQLSQLPIEIIQLQNLRSLNFSYNQLSQLPIEIGQLQNLRSLDLMNNQLSQLPPEITQLQNLRSLYLRDNQFNQLPMEVIQLLNLEELNLQNNQLSQLPSEIRQLMRLKKLDLRGNPIPIPPEMLGPKDEDADPGDVHEILEFYFRVQDPNATELLHEAKFLIVGAGGAGKTSLAKKVEDEAYDLQTDEKSTQGIEVIRWNFPLPGGQEFRVNIWDFGGQEIYHHTHQFFLTERSLYALVADTRTEDTNFYWWLKIIELLSDNSPVFIIKNEKQDRQCVVNERQLKGEFANLKEVFATNLSSNRGLTEIKDAIQHYISKLHHVGTPFPKLWVKVRLALENDSRNTLSLPEYYELCRTNGLTDQTDRLRLSRYLHDLGVCLHFHDDPVLKYTVILKPEWGTTAVYKVLDNDKVNQHLGCFTGADLADIWQNSTYADKRDELLRLMMRFKLCYEIPGSPNTYIAPQLLSIDQPDYDWDDSHNLILRYDYEFMPDGIITRFIVEMHPWIEEQTLVWRNGVVLFKDQTRAEVIEHYNQREMRVKVSGSRKKELLAVVTHELDKIHKSFERLKFRQLIPCNCDVCKGSPKPFCYDFERLKQFLDRRQYQIMCYESGQDVEIRRLIDDVLLQSEFLRSPLNPPNLGDFGSVPPKIGGLGGQNPLQQDLDREKEAILARSAQPQPKPMRDLLFISYSHKDKKWFDDLKLHLEPFIREQNLKIWDDTQIQPGAIWRNEIEAALAATKVAVLLVSPGFLGSSFIAQNELPPLLDAVKAEGVKILWIPLRASSYEATAIEQYQAVHPTNQPLNGISTAKRDQAWVAICRQIKAAANHE